jgi:Kef-type K+ transport system membrane component KefB
MDNLFLPAWSLHHNEVMSIAVALLVAGLVGEGLARFTRLPRVTGYALGGLLLGPALSGWFGAHDIATFRIVIDLALALLLFELGNRVDLKWFRTNPWIIPASLAEAGLTFIATLSSCACWMRRQASPRRSAPLPSAPHPPW